jgi:hypothetical protein
MATIISPHQLEKVALLPQAVDNQWLSDSLLNKVYKKSLSLNAIDKERIKESRTEWLRSLLYSNQVVINRAYLYNNGAIYNDFINPKSEEAVAFRKLLESKAIIPFLFNENPGEMPKGFGVSEEGWDGWNNIGGNSAATFVKFNPDPDVNNREIKNMGASYRSYFTGLLTDEEVGPLILGEFFSREEDALRCYNYFRSGIRSLEDEILAFNQNNKDRQDVRPKQLAREFLYGKFVWNDDDFEKIKDPLFRRIDGNKPFAKELKKIFDLKYNVNLPDYLDKFPLTPYGMPERTTLHDELLIRQPGSEVDHQTLLDSIRRIAVSKVLSGTFIKTVGYLGMKDLLVIRGLVDQSPDKKSVKYLHESWQDFVKIQSNLFDHPFDFPDLAPEIEDKFGKLNSNIVKWLKPRVKNDMIAKSQPCLKYVFEAGSQVLEIASMFVNNTETALLMKLSGKFSKFAGPWVTGKIVVGSYADLKLVTDMQLSMYFMHKRMNNTQKGWQEIVDEIRKSNLFREVDEFPADLAPNVSLPQ